MGVRLLIDRPGLAAALARRGIGVGERVVVAPAARLHDARVTYPEAAILAVAAGPVGEAAALDAGADDSVAADAPDVLIAARAARLLGRGVTIVGELRVDRLTRRAHRAGIPLDLRFREFALLEHLACRAGHLVTREELVAAVLGRPFDPGTNVLTVHLSRLRQALDHGFAFPMLWTERGHGYRLVAGPDATRYRVKRPT